MDTPPKPPTYGEIAAQYLEAVARRDDAELERQRLLLELVRMSGSQSQVAAWLKITPSAMSQAVKKARKAVGR